MTQEEDTEEGRLRRIINEEVQLPQTGIVTQVYEHTQTDDPWNYHVDVLIDGDRHPRKVPVATGIPDLTAPPRSSNHADGPDLVLVQYLHDSEEARPVVTDILYNNEDRAAIGSEGMVRLKRGSLYVELANDGSWARIAKKSGDDVAPDAHVEVEDDGSFIVSDDAGMGLSSDGAGNLKLYGNTIDTRTDGSTL